MWEKIKDKWQDVVSRVHDWKYRYISSPRLFLRNVWRFRKELWEFRSWDHGYAISMFAKSLEEIADNLLDETLPFKHVGHVKSGRRCKYSAEMLRRLVRDYDETYINRRHSYWISRKFDKSRWVEVGNLFRLDDVDVTPIVQTMLDKYGKLSRKQEEEERLRTFQYISKYICTWWS